MHIVQNHHNDILVIEKLIIEKKREACLVMRAPESLHIYGLQNREAYFKDMCTVRDLVWNHF